MAFVLKNGYDVERASSMVVYENLMPEIQHINGKGITDKYTMTDAIESVNAIDVMRILPQPPRFRQLGAAANGGWANKKNAGGVGSGAPQSEHYTVPVDLVYDEIVPIANTQDFSNPINLKAFVQGNLVATMGLSINVVTHAKQLEAYFADNFTTGDAQEGEIAKAVFTAKKGVLTNEDESYTSAFMFANGALTKGIPEIGAFVVPVNERQAFVSVDFDVKMKQQYRQNASEAAARINATGYANPFNQSEGVRINVNTGLAGMYDGVDLFILNDVVKQFVYVALGLASSDAEIIASLDKIEAEIMYAGATLRGIVGPSIEVNKNPYGRGIIISPMLKMGVKCISGKGIKMVVKDGWTALEINAITNKIKFTPIDGETVTADDTFAKGVFNDGTSI